MRDLTRYLLAMTAAAGLFLSTAAVGTAEEEGYPDIECATSADAGFTCTGVIAAPEECSAPTPAQGGFRSWECKQVEGEWKWHYLNTFLSGTCESHSAAVQTGLVMAITCGGEPQ
jgi:hypothetical protein